MAAVISTSVIAPFGSQHITLQKLNYAAASPSCHDQAILFCVHLMKVDHPYPQGILTGIQWLTCMKTWRGVLPIRGDGPPEGGRGGAPDHSLRDINNFKHTYFSIYCLRTQVLTIIIIIPVDADQGYNLLHYILFDFNCRYNIHIYTYK